MGYIIYNKDSRGNSSSLYLLLFIYVGNTCKRIYRWFFFKKLYQKLTLITLVYYWMVTKLICKYEITWWYFVGVMPPNPFGLRPQLKSDVVTNSSHYSFNTHPGLHVVTDFFKFILSNCFIVSTNVSKTFYCLSQVIASIIFWWFLIKMNIYLWKK